MRCPRLEIRVAAVSHNARVLVERLGTLGIAVCGVTKATLGSPDVARALLDAGVSTLGDARLENVERLRGAGISAEIALLRSPMTSEIDRVVESVDVSLNSELDVVALLSASARGRRKRHGVVLMVELGDLREGVMPCDVLDAVERVIAMPGIELRGIGANLACRSGIVPDRSNMAELSVHANAIESEFAVDLDIVSGGNSANIAWALATGVDVGRVNHLRLGEAILLGREPLLRSPIDGLELDAFTVVGEVIESKTKPVHPRGAVGQAAFGELTAVASPATRTGGVDAVADDRTCRQVIVAVGRQDIDPDGLVMPDGFRILGASSDHLVLEAQHSAPGVGDELRFGVNYSALLRAMTSGSVTPYYFEASPASAASPDLLDAGR